MTPYSLVYVVEVVLPLERQIPSLRIAIQEGLTKEENVKLRLQELEALDKKRLEAKQHLRVLSSSSLECIQQEGLTMILPSQRLSARHSKSHHHYSSNKQ